MAIKLQCACGKNLSIKDELAGRRVKCPGCQTLLRVPKPKVEEAAFGDEWDLGDSAEDNWDEEPSKTRAKSRGGKSLPTRGSNSPQTAAKAKGKKSQPSNRGLLIGLSAGGGLLGIALLAWMFWPAKPETNVAVAPTQNTAGSESTTGGDSTSSTNTTSVNSGSQPSSTAMNSSAPTTAIATKLEGDLKLLQGTWQVSDVGIQADQPGAAKIKAEANQVTFTVEDDILRMVTPGGTSISSMKLDSTREPKGIDLIPLDRSGAKTQLGIYSLAGDSWTVCLSHTSSGTVRPTAMLPSTSLGHAVLMLKRGTSAVTPVAQFDIKAWQQASGKLQTMKVKASLEKSENFAGPESLTHLVLIDPPETVDGTMSPELWAIVSSISHVFVRTTYVTDATLQQLSQHPGLFGFIMSKRSTVTTDGIGALKACPQLQVLIFSVPVSPDVCEACSQLKHLRSFGISDSPVSKDMLTSIVRLSELESLTLQNTGITDEAALQIQKLTKLTNLNLSNSQLTDEGLKALTSLTQLKRLVIDKSKVTDQGLKTLKSFTGLKALWVQGLNLTPQALAELEASLPNCRVVK